MRKLLFALSILCAVCASASVDSISYAAGHRMSIFYTDSVKFAGRADRENFIRGLRENMPRPELLRDTAYMISYSMGAMQGIFIADSEEHRPHEKRVPVDCIVRGLMRVADGDLQLPQDTVEAMAVIDRYPDDFKPEDMPDDEKCRFFEAFGIMKGLQPGLQDYINESFPTGNLEADQRVFALGMAEMLRFYFYAPRMEDLEAYELGMTLAKSIMFSHNINIANLNPDDFIAGAESAFGLVDPIIPDDECERIWALYEKSKYKDIVVEEEVVVEEEPYDSYKEKIGTGKNCKVDWKVEVFGIADASQAPEYIVSIFNKTVADVPDSNKHPGSVLAASTTLANGSYVESIYKHKLPAGYGWYICPATTHVNFGIIRTTGSFKADVSEIYMEHVDQSSEYYQAQFRFSSDKAEEWAEFTRANIGRDVAMSINGMIVMTPRVNCEITGGSCAISFFDDEMLRILVGSGIE